MVLKNLLRRKGRTILTILSIGIGVYAIVLISALADGMGSGYNSMITFIGAVPYLEDSLVFAFNHTFTDEVVGIAAALRKRVGRSRVAESLADHLSEVRRRLED